MNKLKGIIQKLHIFEIQWVTQIRNKKNQRRLTNRHPMLISNNCTGAFIYRWLGLQFTSPFIWLRMSEEDYIQALEHLNDFLSDPLEEDMRLSAENGFPVGVTRRGQHIFFSHYHSYEEAVNKWCRRKNRMLKNTGGVYSYDIDHMGFLFVANGSDRALVERFSRLPYPHKVALISSTDLGDISSTYLLRGWNGEKFGPWTLQNKITGKRYIDQFDYVAFLNSMNE